MLFAVVAFTGGCREGETDEEGFVHQCVGIGLLSGEAVGPESRTEGRYGAWSEQGVLGTGANRCDRWSEAHFCELKLTHGRSFILQLENHL
jgi:hypothetical protein